MFVTIISKVDITVSFLGYIIAKSIYVGKHSVWKGFARQAPLFLLYSWCFARTTMYPFECQLPFSFSFPVKAPCLLKCEAPAVAGKADLIYT